jgi:hypothetical protein
MRAIRLLAFVAALAITTPAFAAQMYLLTELSFADADFRPGAINEQGQIAGVREAYGGANDGDIYIWQNGSFTHLGNPGGDASVRGMNDNGDVVGNFAPSGGGAAQAYALVNGTFQTLPGLGGTNNVAYDINNSGLIGGGGRDASGANKAWLYNGALTVVGNGFVRDINESGAYVTSNPLLSSGQTALNDVGGTAGYRNYTSCDYSSGYCDLLDIQNGTYSDGVFTTLLTPPECVADPSGCGSYSSGAIDINNSGLVVGTTYQTPRCTLSDCAWLWDGDGFYNLEDLVVDMGDFQFLGSSVGINDAGQIVGIGTTSNGFTGFLLTPTVVPVPAAAWLFASGLGLLGWIKRRAPLAR